jgi:NADP-dependent 3-hydroxy acid dehydrogenase YdfG
MSVRTVVITGASGGIGAALAAHLAPLGHSLVLVARRDEALRAVAATCGANALPVVADVTSRADVQRIVREAIARFGQVDVWVNNVGQGISRATSELTDDDIDDVMRINVKSALYGMQEILPHFKARGTGQIINVSSMLGRVPFAPIRSAYCGAKHFLNAITSTLRLELQAQFPGIIVSLVSPGVVRTDFGLNAKHGGPDSRSFPESQSAEEVASVIAQVIEQRTVDAYTFAGAKSRITGYYTATGIDLTP